MKDHSDQQAEEMQYVAKLLEIGAYTEEEARDRVEKIIERPVDEVVDFDTIMCTQAVKDKLLLTVTDTGLDFRGIKIFTAHSSVFKGMKTRDGRPCNMVLINAGALHPVGKFRPFDPKFDYGKQVATWKQSYTYPEITAMRCEIVALSRKLYVTNDWSDYADKIRFGSLRKCLGLLGFWYQGGDCFEMTDGTDML